MKEEWWNGRQTEIRPGLERIDALLERLGRPERGLPVVHVAGTNGKGSTAAMIATGLEAQGFRVGLFTSPDLGEINERVMINRQPIAEEVWDRLGQTVEDAGWGLPDTPTFFEAVTALGFLAFQEAQVDVAVVEVGLGGRLDSTNIVPPPRLAVITPVAYDHMDRLGSTIEAIAWEKAGILKAPSPLVLARQPYPSAEAVILSRARQLGIRWVRPEGETGHDGEVARYRSPAGTVVEVPLAGRYQADNLATAWTALEVLHAGGYCPDLEAARLALQRFQWPGRFQVVERQPLVVFDGAHNPHGIAAVVETLQQPPWRRYRWQLVFAALSDKPGLAMWESLASRVAGGVITEVPSARRTPVSEWAGRLPATFSVEPDPLKALAVALARVEREEGDAILVTGSLALLAHLNRADALRALLSRR